jgi:hypothetical protein
MIIKDLINVIFDDVILYQRVSEDFEDIFKGKFSNIPNELTTMKVGNIGARKKNVLDIRVE